MAYVAGNTATGYAQVVGSGQIKFTQYDSAGNEVTNPNLPLYCAQINVAPLSVLSGTVYWALKAAAQKQIMAVWFEAKVSHVSLSSTVGQSLLELVAISSGNFTSNFIPATIYPYNAAATTVIAAVNNSGIIMSGGASSGFPTLAGTGPIMMGCPSQFGSQVSQDFVAAGNKGWNIAAGAGVCLRAANTQISGVSINGAVIGSSGVSGGCVSE
jgi:hypothetical protein